MSAESTLHSLLYVILILVVIGIILIIFFKVWDRLMIAPLAFATSDADADNQEKDVANQDEPIVEGKETIKTNDTDIHITCTSNIPDLVSC